MNPVLIIPVQIPYHLFMHFKNLVNSIPADEMHEWNIWRKQLYQDTNGTLPLVQYFVGGMSVPDTYGYLYTLHIMMEGMENAK